MSEYQTLNEIEISSSALISNYNFFQKLNPHSQICPVLKSNAYGHGLIPIAKIVDQSLHPPYIMVDSLFEAYELLKANIKTPIMIMGYTDPQNYSIWKKLPFTFGVYDSSSLLSLNQHQPGAKIHIKLDTGMCRLGLQKKDLSKFINTLKKCPHLLVEGIYSHLSQASDPLKNTFTNRQIKLFKEMCSAFEDAGFSFKYKHLAATSSASTLTDSTFNLVRLGLGFYGYSPFGTHSKEGRSQRSFLQPALTFSSRLALIKPITSGSQVGYNGTYIAKQDELIAILTAGYFEGIPYLLSNRATFLLHHTKCPLIGNVAMNMTTIKIPRTINAKVGDTVTIISPRPEDPCSLYKLAAILNVPIYTILTSLNPSIRRKIL